MYKMYISKCIDCFQIICHKIYGSFRTSEFFINILRTQMWNSIHEKSQRITFRGCKDPTSQKRKMLVTRIKTNAWNSFQGHEHKHEPNIGTRFDAFECPSCSMKLVCRFLYALAKLLSGNPKVIVWLRSGDRGDHGTMMPALPLPYIQIKHARLPTRKNHIRCVRGNVLHKSPKVCAEKSQVPGTGRFCW